MLKESPLEIVLNVIIAVAANLLTIAVGYYIYLVFWAGTPPDYHIVVSGRTIPPQTYPFLLFAFWSAFQRWAAHVRPENEALWWADLVLSSFVAGFIGLSILKVGFNNPDPTYLLILIGFLVGTIVDVFGNGQHRFAGKAPIYVTAPSTALSTSVPIESPATGEIPPIPERIVEMPVKIRPVFYMQKSDGSTVRMSSSPALVDHVQQATVQDPPQVAASQ